MSDKSIRKSITKAEWKMPEWMEDFRDLIESGCGGNTAEELMNRYDVNYFNNPLVCELVGMCRAKITLLTRLQTLGCLRPWAERQQVQT